MFEVREGRKVVMSLSREQTVRMCDYLDRMREPEPVALSTERVSARMFVSGRIEPDTP